MKEKTEKKLEKITLEKTEDVRVAGQIIRETAQRIGAFTDFQKVFVAAVLEKTGSSSLPFEQLKTIIPYNLSEEITEIVEVYTVWMRIHTFCIWSSISSIVFLISGIYLLLIGYMPIEIGGPLVILFGLLSSVFLKKLLQWRKP